MAITLANTSRAGNDAASATTIASAASVLTTGNRNTVAVRWSNASSLTAVTDTAGNTYTSRRKTVGFSTTIEVFECASCTGHAANVVTATFAAGVSNRSIVTAEWAGSSSYTLAFVASDWNSSTGAAIEAGGYVVGDDYLAVAWFQVDATGGTWTLGSGLTSAVEDASNVLLAAYAIVTSSTTLTPDASCSSTARKVGIMAVWTTTGGGGGSTEFAVAYVG